MDDRSLEEKIHADWGDLSAIHAGSIDVVLGDCALNNVLHVAMPQVMRELARVLRPGGRYALRQVVRPDVSPGISELTSLRRANRISLPAFRNAVRHCCFDEAAFDTDTQVRDATLVFAMVDAARDSGLLDDAEYAVLCGTRSALRLTTYPHSTQRELLEQWLGPCGVHVSGDLPAALTAVRIYVGRRGPAG